MSEVKNIPARLQKMESSLCLHQWDFPCVNLASAKVRACCRIYPRPLEESSIQKYGKDAIFNDDHNRDRRLDMLNGIRHQECNSCWQLEDNGAPSPRLGIPEFMEKMQKRLKVTQEELVSMMLEPEKHPAILKSYHTFELEISFGNKCDLACVYCSYIYSSRIAQEDIEAGTLDKTTYDLEMKSNTDRFQNVFWEWFAEEGMKSLEVVNIIGGEPLINDLFYENIERMIDICEKSTIQREKKILVQIITNLNAPPHYIKKFIAELPRLAKHFQLSILASMESTGTRAEYIRYGVNFARFQSNFEEILSNCRDHLYQFGFLSSINVLSITSLPDFLKFALDIRKRHNWPVYLGYNQVLHPEVMSVLSLGPEFASYIHEAISFMDEEKENLPETWETYRQSLIRLEETVRTLRTDKASVLRLKDWIERNDSRRKLDFAGTFPEYTTFLGLR